MKSNDNIPADEMLLAEALAAAKGNGLGWCSGMPYRDNLGWATRRIGATKCCVLGALEIAGLIKLDDRISEPAVNETGVDMSLVVNGNDNDTDDPWVESARGDAGESLGWAFRCAMEEQ